MVYLSIYVIIWYGYNIIAYFIGYDMNRVHVCMGRPLRLLILVNIVDDLQALNQQPIISIALGPGDYQCSAYTYEGF